MSRNSIIINEENYRAIDALSYSALSLYSKDIKKFYHKYILKESDQESSEFIKMGNMVDIKMTEPDNFDKYFVVTTANKPSGQLLTLTDFLFELRTQDLETNFETLFDRAYALLEESNGGKVRDKKDTFIKNFDEKGKEYFAELLSSRGKTVITIEEDTTSDLVVKKIRTTEAFRPKGDITIHKQVLRFSILDNDFKCEIDEIDIDTKNKIIYPFDYKMSSFINTFTASGYINNNYYIQGGVYKYGIESCLDSSMKEFKGFKVEPLAFKVADQVNYFDPLLYKTTDQHYNQAFSGFYFGRSYKKGIFALINEITESKSNNVWSMQIENFKNGGQVYIQSFKESLDE